MALTPENLQALKAPFAAGEHEFLRGFTYLREEAITERIEQIDPSWEFHIQSIAVRPNVGERGKDILTVTAHAALTLGGVTRESTGMAFAQRTDEKPVEKWEQGRKVKTGETYTSEANEAEKSATTDALKRCARLFGIGRYLLNLPDDVKDEASLKRWLDDQSGKLAQPKAEPPPPASNGNPVKYGQSTMEVETVKPPNGKQHMLIEGARLYSRDAFRALGFHENVLADLHNVGQHLLSDSITITYIVHGSYNSVETVRRDSTGQIVDIHGKTLVAAKQTA